jgi:hypothetical protein
MAANRTVTSLSIALIVFVMLTFVLAITTYVFFKQRLDEQARADDAVTETAKARTELQAAVDEKQKIQEDIIGVAREKTFAEIELEKTERIAKDFAGFNDDPKTLLKLVTWLADALAAKDGQMDKLRQEKDKELAEKVTALEAEKSLTGQKETEREKLEKEIADTKKQFDSDRTQFEKQQDKLTTERQQALDETTNFERLKTEVEKLRQSLPPPQQKTFESKKEPEEKLQLVYRSLTEMQKVIKEQNAVLAKLNTADPAVREAVIKATPKDDRVEQFDGRVLAVNERDRSAVLSFTSTGGLRPGHLFDVFDRSDVRPLASGGKGVVELLAVEGETRARGRILSDSTRSPILAGDALASGLWSPGLDMEVVIVGYVQFDRDRESDVDELVSRIEKFGGRVVDTVTPATGLVVDAGLPRTTPGDTKMPTGWRPVDVARRTRQLELAKNLGIRTVTVDAMLEMLGTDREDIETGRLPRRGLERSTPR